MKARPRKKIFPYGVGEILILFSFRDFILPSPAAKKKTIGKFPSVSSVISSFIKYVG